MAHLTTEDRSKLEFMLKQHYSLINIAKELDKHCSTISREIKKHAVPTRKVFYGRLDNCCIHKKGCKITYLCERDISACNRDSCSFCKHCNDLCSEFVEEKCQRLTIPPYVCNGCELERYCVLRKKYYIACKAQKEYKEVLVQVRTGANISEQELLYIDNFFSPLLKNGQSIHHIFAKNMNAMICSEKSIYRYVNGSLLKARNLDLPRVVRIKQRKTKPVIHKIDPACYIKRTYEDYKNFIKENPDVQIVEMDSVEGVKGGKVLLTLHFKGLCDFMLAFIRDCNNAQTVIDIFENLYSTLKPDLFKKLFKCILTDRGSEFTNPTALEIAPDGTKRSNIFFCDPQASWQKPNVELNHELIRRILPKGTSFNNLTQSDINLMMNHINSYGREKLNYKSPMEALSSLFGQEVLDLLDAKLISPNEIVIHPKLLKK